MKQIANDIFFQHVEQELSNGNPVLIPLKGTSMFPFIRNGKDKVLLSAVTPDTTLQKLDTVLFRYRGNHVLHRIISIDGDTYTIQGDAIYASHETCTRQDIIAKAVEIHRLRSGLSFRIILTSSFSWKLLSGLWHFFRPVRRYFLFIFLRCPFLQ